MRKVLNILTCFAAIGLCAPNASAMKLTFEDSLWTGWFESVCVRRGCCQVGVY